MRNVEGEIQRLFAVQSTDLYSGEKAEAVALEMCGPGKWVPALVREGDNWVPMSHKGDTGDLPEPSERIVGDEKD